MTCLGLCTINKGQPNEEAWLVMELLSKGDLRSYLINPKNDVGWAHKVR